MATNALRMTDNALRHVFTAAGSITANTPVEFSSTDLTIVAAGADDPLTIGIARDTVSSGEDCNVYLLGFAVVPMKVGTGGVTRGNRVRMVADGITNIEAAGGGTTPHYVIGQAMQSGAVGDIVGVLIGGPSAQVSAS